MTNRFLAALAILAVAALSFGPAAAQPNSAPLQPLTVAVSGKALIGQLPPTLADRLGYFRDEGLSVQLEDFEAGTKSVDALVGGSVNMMFGALEYTIVLQPKGMDLVTVVLDINKAGIAFGLRPDLAKTYRSPADLKGLRIGVTSPGSATENILRIVLQKAGLTLGDVVEIGVGTGASAVAAMESNRIDGIIIADPVMTKLTGEGEVIPIVDTRTEAGQTYVYGGPTAFGGSFTTAKFIKEHPQQVQAYVNAIVRTLKWMHNSNVDRIFAAVPPEYYGRDPDLYKRSLAAALNSYVADGRVTMAEVENSYKQILSAGRLTKDDKIDLAATFDNAFAGEANKKY